MNEITVTLPYGLIMRNDRLVEELGLNPYLISEGIVDSGDTKTIEITPENARILDYIKLTLVI